MFCENCGKPNSDGACFCESCGAPLEAPAAASQAAPAGNFCENCGHPNTPDTHFCENCGAPMNAPVAAPVAPAAPKENIFSKLHKKNKFILPGIGAGILAIIVAIVLMVVLGGQIKMNDYMKFEVEGVNGYGTFDYSFDRTTLAMRVLGNKNAKGYMEDSDEYWGMSALQQLLQRQDIVELINSIKVDTEFPEGVQNGQLKNGDVVKIKITCDETLAKACDVKLKAVEVSYKVEGLGEAQAYDVLSAFTVAFEGYNGYGTCTVKCTEATSVKVGTLLFTVKPDWNEIEVTSDDGLYDTLHVSAPTKENMRNGDILHFDMGISPTRFAIYGVVLEGIEQDFEVTGLKDPETVNLFDYYDFNLTGISGDGSIAAEPKQETVKVGDLEIDLEGRNIYSNGDYVTGYYIYFSDSYNLSNGDSITVELNVDSNYLSRYGLELTATSMEMKLEGLGEYASDVASIKNASNFGEYTEAAKAEITEELQDSWAYLVHDTFWGSFSDTTVADMELYKVVFASRDVESYYSVKNYVYIVFTATLSDNTMTPTQHYVVARCDNAVIYPDGTVSMGEPYAYYDAFTTYEKLYDYIESSSYAYQEG